jgi:SAM-dependent methyltransferase
MSVSDHTDRLSVLETQFELLRLGVVGGSIDGSVLPPVGVVADYLNEEEAPTVRRRAARDHLLIPDEDNREGYLPGDPLGYWKMGLADYDKVLAACARHAVTGHRVFDFGGSTGRLFRHFYCQDRRFDVWSSDLKVSTFRWNQRYLPSDIRVFLNTHHPPLPLPDHHFDLITAFSVFTHIDQLESAWLLELRRILKPGGLLYVTVHDEHCWEHKSAWLLDALQHSVGGDTLNEDSPFPGPRASYDFRTDSFYACNVFHSEDYLLTQWGRYFDILELRPLDAGTQCVALLSHSD